MTKEQRRKELEARLDSIDHELTLMTLKLERDIEEAETSPVLRGGLVKLFELKFKILDRQMHYAFSQMRGIEEDEALSSLSLTQLTGKLAGYREQIDKILAQQLKERN